MNIIPNGTTVQIIIPKIKGIVMAAEVSGVDSPHIHYKVVFWAGGVRLSEWLDAIEVEIFVDTTKKPGMVNYEDKPSKLIETEE